VLGITGGIGSAIASALAGRGWTIRALTKRAASSRPSFAFPVEWLEGDAMGAASVRAAADGASLIVHAVNPPGYRRWREAGLPLVFAGFRERRLVTESRADAGAGRYGARLGLCSRPGGNLRQARRPRHSDTGLLARAFCRPLRRHR